MRVSGSVSEGMPHLDCGRGVTRHPRLRRMHKRGFIAVICGQVRHSSRLERQLIAALVLRMPCVPSEPLEMHLVSVTEAEELFPEVPIFGHFLVRAIPTVGAPAARPTLLDGVDDIF